MSKCFTVSKDYKRVLGAIAIGKVVGIGVGVQGVSEGSRVIVFPVSAGAPIEIDGACQSIYSIDIKYVLEASQKAFNDLEMLFIASLSIHKKVLDTIKGLSTLIVGNDISILPFAYYSMLYSSKFAIIPRYTLWPELVKGEHVSIYNGRKFDAVILASPDPLVNNIILKSYRDTSIIIIHPSILSTLRSDSLLHPDAEKRILTMKFGDIATGIEVFNIYREHLIKNVELLNFNSISKSIKAPLIIQIN